MNFSSHHVILAFLALSLSAGLGCRQPAQDAGEQPAPETPRNASREDVEALGVSMDDSGLLRGSFPEGYPTSAPVNTEPLQVEVPDPSVATLANGVTLLHTPYDRLPLASVSVDVAAGHVDDPDGLVGLSAITARMLDQGAGGMSSDDLALAFDSIGASLTVTSSLEHTRISLTVAADRLSEAGELLGAVLTQPTFAGPDLERIRARMLSELEQSEVDPEYVSAYTLDEALFGAHPYGRRSLTRASLEAVTAEQIREFHAARFRGPQTTISIAGGGNLDDVTDVAKAMVGGMSRTEAAARALAQITPELGQAADAPRVILVNRPGSVQTTILYGQLAHAWGGEDEVLDRLAVGVLGGGASARLFMEMRERRSLTYGAYAWTQEGDAAGSLRAEAAVRTPQTGEGVAVMLGEIAKLRDEAIPASELQDAVNARLGRIARATTSVDRLAGAQATRWLRPDRAQPWAERIGAYSGVEAGAVSARASTLLASPAPVLVLVGDVAAFAEGVSSLPWLQAEVTDFLAAGIQE